MLQRPSGLFRRYCRKQSAAKDLFIPWVGVVVYLEFQQKLLLEPELPRSSERDPRKDSPAGGVGLESCAKTETRGSGVWSRVR